MNSTLTSTDKNIFTRPKKDALIRARCSRSLMERVHRVAALLEKDSSDLIRDAVVQRVTEFESRLRVA